jgi:flagellar biosynthesis chaperone FliJ
MDNNLIMTAIELKREDLIEILRKENCTDFEMTQHAIEEYILGIPLYEDDWSNYNNFRKHFEQRILKNRNGDPKFSYGMEQTLERLFSNQISKSYIHLKKKVYEYFTEQQLKDKDDQTRIDLDDAEDYFDFYYYHYEQLNVNEEILDSDLKIIKTKKTRK